MDLNDQRIRWYVISVVKGPWMNTERRSRFGRLWMALAILGLDPDDVKVSMLHGDGKPSAPAYKN